MTSGDRPEDELLFDLPLEPPDEVEPAATVVPSSPESESRPPAPPRLEETVRASIVPTIASVWPRLLAGGADLLVHAGTLAATALGLNFVGIEPHLSDWPPLLALLLAFSFLYTVVSLAFWGQTAGMAWFGLAARQSPQFPLSFSQATRRWLGGLLTVVLVGLPILLAFWGASLSDRISASKTYRGFAGAS